MTAYPVPGIQETHSKYFHTQANVFIQDCGVDPGVGTTKLCFVTKKHTSSKGNSFSVSYYKDTRWQALQHFAQEC